MTNLYRSLSVPDTDNLKPLVVYLNISDALITASSGSGKYHAAHRVRMDRYFHLACAWVAEHGDQDLGCSLTWNKRSLFGVLP